MHAGRTPRTAKPTEPTVRDLVNQFLTDKRGLVDVGELAEQTWHDYNATAGRLIAALGVTRPLSDIKPEDFASIRAAFSSTWGLTTIGNEINRSRVIFNYAGPDHLGMIEHRIAFGPMFKKPSRKRMRIARAGKPKRLFEPSDLRAAIDAAGPTLRAMILIGINAGLGNRDCALLTFDKIEGDWLNYPRPKTGVDRRAKLWPETRAAIDAACDHRGIEKRLPGDPVFTTKYGRPWLHNTKAKHGSCPISSMATKLFKKLGFYHEGLTFYALRHTFQTIGDRSGDRVAVSAIMGHVDNSMAGNYREMIEDSRLEAVANVVRKWLFEQP